MAEFNQYTSVMRLPPGWRRFGYIHSHPILDTLNSVALSFSNGPEAKGIGVTWSGKDFKSLTDPIKNGHKNDMVLGVITPIQIGFMVATKKTLEVLGKKDKETTKLSKVTWMDLPPYKNFEKLGIVLYAGNHIGFGKNITLQRLIY